MTRKPLFSPCSSEYTIQTLRKRLDLSESNGTLHSSPWCRPLRLHFFKQFTMKEISCARDEIATRSPFVATITGIQLKVLFELILSMIDGKTLAAVTDTDSMKRCCICKATPKQLNNLNNMDVRIKPKEETLRLDVKAWQLRGPPLKAKAKKR